LQMHWQKLQKYWKDRLNKNFQQKVVDDWKFSVIIISSAMELPNQLYLHNTQLEGG